MVIMNRNIWAPRWNRPPVKRQTWCFSAVEGPSKWKILNQMVYSVLNLARFLSTEWTVIVFCVMGSAGEILSELITSLEQLGAKYSVLYASDPHRAGQPSPYPSLGRFLAEGAGQNGSANLTYCDGVCQIKSSLLEGLFVVCVSNSTRHIFLVYWWSPSDASCSLFLGYCSSNHTNFRALLHDGNWHANKVRDAPRVVMKQGDTFLIWHGRGLLPVLHNCSHICVYLSSFGEEEKWRVFDLL